MHYGVGVITGLVHYAIFAMLVPLHSCWHPDPAQSSAALFHSATAPLEADDAQHFLGGYLESATGLFLAKPLSLETLAALHLLL